jgi:hypothetical protein
VNAAELIAELERSGHRDLADALRGREPAADAPVDMNAWLRQHSSGMSANQRRIGQQLGLVSPDEPDDPPAAA